MPGGVRAVRTTMAVLRWWGHRRRGGAPVHPAGARGAEGGRSREPARDQRVALASPVAPLLRAEVAGDAVGGVTVQSGWLGMGGVRSP